MFDFILGLVFGAGFMLWAVVNSIGGVPDVPDFCKQIDAKTTYVIIYENTKGEQFYQFNENGKLVTIKKNKEVVK